MRWRIGLVDSGGPWQAAVASARFANDGRRMDTIVADPTGHGERVAALIRAAEPGHELLIAQVFDSAGPTTAAAVVAGIEWCRNNGAQLLHLSLGLAVDRPALAAVIERTLQAGCLVVAATPARGPVVYPAAYPGVIRATGDARCAVDELSRLDPVTFGGCVRPVPAGPASAGRGASVGAAAVTGTLLTVVNPGCTLAQALAALGLRVRYSGPEQRSAPA